MKDYLVYTTETVVYCYKVKAENEKEAEELVRSGDYLDSDWVDSYGFTISEIIEEE